MNLLSGGSRYIPSIYIILWCKHIDYIKKVYSIYLYYSMVLTYWLEGQGIFHLLILFYGMNILTREARFILSIYIILCFEIIDWRGKAYSIYLYYSMVWTYWLEGQGIFHLFILFFGVNILTGEARYIPSIYIILWYEHIDYRGKVYSIY